ncbi:MAG: hypothetical protein AAF439_11375 [Pseudomonadota bacterium]
MSAAAKGQFIAFRSDRLGARLVSLLNAMRLAEDYETGFQCAWMDSIGVGSTFNNPSELFDGGFVDKHFLSAPAWQAARPLAETLSGQMQNRADLVVKTLAGGQNMIVGNAFGVIALSGEDPDAVTKRFRAQFRKVPFSAPVADAMARLGAALDGHTAYHIRRGDLTGDPKAMNKAWPHKMVPNEFYERHMAGVLTGDTGGVAMFSDDQASIEHYRVQFPALKTVGDIIDVSVLTEAQNDLLELYAMSCCARIIAPDRSAFSSTAADLSGAVKQSVTDSMDQAQVDEAHQALADRLSTRPESFAGEGDIGQSLAHVGGWLEDQKRWPEAAKLFSDRVASGLNISFVYPRTMTFQHRADDTEGVLRTAAMMSERPIMHVKDQASSEVLRGYAHLRQGNRAAGLRHVINGLWHHPGVQGAQIVPAVLVASGWLASENFLPFGPAQMALHQRRGPLKALLTDFPALTMLDGIQVPIALANLEPLTWEWAPMMRALSVQAQARRGAVARMQVLLNKLPDDQATRTERIGIGAMFDAFGGDADCAADVLTAETKNTPEDPLLWQRLSHAHWIARRFGKAATTARTAAEHAPDWPVMQAWAGMCLLRVREPEEALSFLEGPATANVGLPSLPWLCAQARAMTGDIEGGLADVGTALSLAPLEVDYAMFAARHLHAKGESRAAADLLQKLVAAHRAPGKLFLQLIDILNEMGESAEAASTALVAQTRVPKHPRINELAAQAA